MKKLKTLLAVVMLVSFGFSVTAESIVTRGTAITRDNAGNVIDFYCIDALSGACLPDVDITPDNK